MSLGLMPCWAWAVKQLAAMASASVDLANFIVGIPFLRGFSLSLVWRMTAPRVVVRIAPNGDAARRSRLFKIVRARVNFDVLHVVLDCSAIRCAIASRAIAHFPASHPVYAQRYIG